MTDATIARVNGGALAPFGTRDQVRELAARLKILLPAGGQNLTVAQITALAQASVAHGLDPMNGEIWILAGRDGESHGMMIGIKGLRKKAREQVKGNFWCDFHEITDPDTKTRYGYTGASLVFECRLFDTETLMTYVGANERLGKSGLPWETIERMVGSRPYTLGIGGFTPGEKTKMKPIQVAMKRAEADAIKRRFDVPLGMQVADDDEPQFSGPWVEGTATEVPVDPEPEPEEPNAFAATQAAMDAEKKAQFERNQQALWGDAA